MSVLVKSKSLPLFGVYLGNGSVGSTMMISTDFSFQRNYLSISGKGKEMIGNF